MKLTGLLRRIAPIALKPAGKLPLCPWKCIGILLNPRTISIHRPEIDIQKLESDDAFQKLRFAGKHDAWFPSHTEIGPELWNEYLGVFQNQPDNFYSYIGHGTPVSAGDVCLDCDTCEGFLPYKRSKPEQSLWFASNQMLRW